MGICGRIVLVSKSHSSGLWTFNMRLWTWIWDFTFITLPCFLISVHLQCFSTLFVINRNSIYVLSITEQLTSIFDVLGIINSCNNIRIIRSWILTFQWGLRIHSASNTAHSAWWFNVKINFIPRVSFVSCLFLFLPTTNCENCQRENDQD